MSSPKHTPGPWRWEVNMKHKTMNLVGGKSRFDLTIMNFDRWGMGGAQPVFRDTNDLLAKATEFIEIIPGREHHADWCQTLNQPDANLIAEAPTLLAMLKSTHAALQTYGPHPIIDNYVADMLKKFE